MASTNSTTSTQTIAIDESHPFFLHQGEIADAILVSKPLLGGENYPTQAQSIQRALSVQNKLGFFDGTVSLIASMVQGWPCCNNIIISWILNCIAPKIATSAVYHNTTLGIQNDLKDRFSHGMGLGSFNCRTILEPIHNLSFPSQITSLN